MMSEEFEHLVHEEYRDLLEIGTSFSNGFNYGFLELPETIVDGTTLNLVQIQDLFEAINHTVTATGSATLLRSLIQPTTSLNLILAKQEGLRELESNDKLRNSIDNYLNEFKQGEEALFRFLTPSLWPKYYYKLFKEAMKCGRTIANISKTIPTSESRYLQLLFDDLKDFNNSDVYRLMRGPIYRTFTGLKSREDTSIFTPTWKFTPRELTLANSSPMIGLAILLGGVSTGYIPRDPRLINISYLLMAGSFFNGLLYTQMLKRDLDDSTVIEPLRKRSLQDEKFKTAIDSLGKLDELLSFYKYGKTLPVDVSIPNITDDKVHYFIAENMRNPIQAKENSSFIPNEVNLNGSRLTIVTGPNSGGKTTYCKSLAQNQILAQIGCYVVASNATINIADRVSYQAPMFDSLQDEEGRFGTELKRTRDIFFKTTPKSLVILDELVEGTTIEEKFRHSCKTARLDHQSPLTLRDTQLR